MFEAMLYMCISFGGPPECVTGENLYGPYATVPECQLRLKEMTENWAPYKTIASLLLWKSIEEGIFS